jgi:hypothetical protein
MMVVNPLQPIPGVQIVGLGHKARHGKDTVANYLLQYGAERMSFADDLYAVARVMFGMREKDPKLLQVLGTDVFRKMNQHIWIESLYYKILERKPKVVIIPDVRFPNEAAFVRSLGGYLVKVTRLNLDGSVFVAPDRDPDHPSEAALNGWGDWDLIINANSGDIQRLHIGAAAIMSAIT